MFKSIIIAIKQCFNQLFFYFVKPTAANLGFNKLCVNAKCLLHHRFKCKLKFLIIIIFIFRLKLQSFMSNHKCKNQTYMRVWLKSLKNPPVAEDVDKEDAETIVKIAVSRGFQDYRYNNKYAKIALLQEELRKTIEKARMENNSEQQANKSCDNTL
jgi:hypothetical protein